MDGSHHRGRLTGEVAQFVLGRRCPQVSERGSGNAWTDRPAQRLVAAVVVNPRVWDCRRQHVSERRLPQQPIDVAPPTDPDHSIADQPGVVGAAVHQELVASKPDAEELGDVHEPLVRDRLIPRPAR